MAPKTTNLAIVFADISGSTKLYEALGDAVARAKCAETIAAIINVVKQHNGTVIKTIGDEVMSTFLSAEEAANACCAMHEAMAEVNENIEDGTVIAIRIGMHFGPAIMEGGDVFGDAVNLAARMAAQSKANQIITTLSTIEKLTPVLRAGTRFIDHAPIKGKQEVIDIYEIIWQEEDMTRMATGMLAGKPTPEVKLRLRYNDQDVQISKKRSSVVLGRSKDCDLPINEKLASRQHVRIELRRDKFFIIDQSTNGTHVRIDNGEDAFLRREEMPLNGNGQISLGKSFNENPTEVVRFTHETS
ncbi:MAG: adenylate/guanylate cyclase domain-containing protein [Gammaproteobacteria bacterium]|nr:adenylate/guanylate cyclase domain-containing protein [Gammaproteobacteria bacterium]